MNTLLFFSNNQNKIKEIKSIFRSIKINILSLNDFPIIKEPKETGKNFVENAKIKSLFGYKNFKIPCFADDSGICISALNNRPGINSKRFLEKFKNNKEAFKYIINKTNIIKNNNAVFKTSICLTLNLNHHVVFEGKLFGKISDTPRGKNGFGYDPIFIPTNCKKTFAEMNNNQKNIMSHRAIAINKLISFL